jgi:hypothetical protein
MLANVLGLLLFIVSGEVPGKAAEREVWTVMMLRSPLD